MDDPAANDTAGNDTAANDTAANDTAANDALPADRHPDPFPTADIVVAAPAAKLAVQVISRLWWVTAICLAAAALLVWSQLNGGGPRIEVTFADGHGIEAGDAVRYRGTLVGRVRRIALADDLDGLTIHVELTRDSAALAREGTQFWIERPELRVGQVRGLDTLLGGRYIGVVPGTPDAPRAKAFRGLETAPEPWDALGDGLEIVLESKDRMGIESGSPVMYRGVRIGSVQSVGLANDSATVRARAVIQSRYRALVCEETRFWSNSGFDVSFGLQGLKLDADTLTTIAAGGVAMATPDPPGRAVTTGHRFELFAAPRDDWQEWQPRIALGNASLAADAPLPTPLLARHRAPSGTLGIFGGRQQRGWLLPLDDGRLLAPATLLAPADEGEAVLEVSGREFPLASDVVSTVGPLAVFAPAEPLDTDEAAWPVEKTRTADAPEDMILTCGSDDKTLPLAAERITIDEGSWSIELGVPIDPSWLGACAVAASDGALIGIVVADGDRMSVAPIRSELLQP